MAIWQFDFYIMPIKNQAVAGDMERMILWATEDVPNRKIEFLEKRTSWSRNIVQYGAEDETCIQFFCENERAMNIFCRLDLRTLTKKMLDEVLLYIKSIQGMIFYNENVYEPDSLVVRTLIKESNAYRFCKDPAFFFESLE